MIEIISTKFQIPLGILIVVFLLYLHQLYETERIKKRIAKISRKMGKILGNQGIISIDFFASDKMSKHVSSDKLLDNLEEKIDRLDHKNT